MWVAELKVWHQGSPLLPLSQKYDVHMYSQYLNSFEEKGVPKIMRVAVLWGKDKEKAVQELKNHEASEIVFREGDQIFFTQKAIRSFHSIVSDKHVFFLSPILEEKGFQWWKVGSNKKENLLQLFKRIQRLEGFATAELVSIKNRKVGALSFYQVPDIPDRDLEWWKTALREGYYEYPRKISLQQLSQRMGIPFSTLKDRLRKAELNIMKKVGQGV